jgi:hypothetical protein
MTIHKIKLTELQELELRALGVRLADATLRRSMYATAILHSAGIAQGKWLLTDNMMVVDDGSDNQQSDGGEDTSRSEDPGTAEGAGSL